MTVDELAANLATYRPGQRVNCIEVADDDDLTLYKIVNLHEDELGIHLIVELVG